MVFLKIKLTFWENFEIRSLGTALMSVSNFLLALEKFGRRNFKVPVSPFNTWTNFSIDVNSYVFRKVKVETTDCMEKIQAPLLHVHTWYSVGQNCNEMLTAYRNNSASCDTAVRLESNFRTGHMSLTDDRGCKTPQWRNWRRKRRVIIQMIMNANPLN